MDSVEQSYDERPSCDFSSPKKIGKTCQSSPRVSTRKIGIAFFDHTDLIATKSFLSLLSLP
jgi:hypothetical protein